MPAEQFFLDLLESGLNDSSNRLYLPTMVKNSTSPVLEPLSIISGNKDLGQQTIPSIDVTVDLQLSDVGLAGLSNVEMPVANIQVSGPNVSFLAEFSKLPGLPPQLTLSGSMQVSNEQDGTLSGRSASPSSTPACRGPRRSPARMRLQFKSLCNR